MKKVLLVTASLIALGAPALAADLAARPYTKAPPMVAAVYDWTGFYIGANVDAFGLFTGQVGYAVNNVLLYVKGGAAVTSNSYRVNNVVGGALAGVTGDDTRWGGTIGAGLEYAFAPNWSVGVEYNHLFMQDRTYTFTTPGGAFFGT